MSYAQRVLDTIFMPFFILSNWAGSLDVRHPLSPRTQFLHLFGDVAPFPVIRNIGKICWRTCLVECDPGRVRAWTLRCPSVIRAPMWIVLHLVLIGVLTTICAACISSWQLTNCEIWRLCPHLRKIVVIFKFFFLIFFKEIPERKSHIWMSHPTTFDWFNWITFSDSF